jgi:hemerythrin
LQRPEKEFEAEHAAGNDESIESVFTFLRDWFLNHILEEDKKIASFIKPAICPKGSRWQ